MQQAAMQDNSAKDDDWKTVLRSPHTIRERSRNIYEAALAGDSPHFQVHEAKLKDAADHVAKITRQRYPDLRVPYHGRFRHFQVGGRDRVAAFRDRLKDASPQERARAEVELVVTSVLLDAGAGPLWHYDEEGAQFTRSEGLGVASFHTYCGGAFSSDPSRPFIADAKGLQSFDADKLTKHFHVTAENPLVGLEGRAALLARLGDVVAQHPAFASDGQEPRLGNLYDAICDGCSDVVPAAHILTTLLETLNPIWPSVTRVEGEALGDVWPHPHAGGAGVSSGFVPFHKLSQWLAYSLFEPLEGAGWTVACADALTGLPEYRNGGLFLDSGVLSLRDAQASQRSHSPGSELIVTWRALTVTLLDQLAPLVRDKLGIDEVDFPLARVLEGGTWHAGRALAQRHREGLPPLPIDSDGTVF